VRPVAFALHLFPGCPAAPSVSAMTSTFDATANLNTDPREDRSGSAASGAAHDAARSLDQLMATVGVDGLVAALRTPGLLAEIDQHAAAVRDAVAAAGREVDALSLAGYARSVAAAAHRTGRSIDGRTADWTRAGWHLLRLTAVCAIADEVGCL